MSPPSGDPQTGSHSQQPSTTVHPATASDHLPGNNNPASDCVDRDVMAEEPEPQSRIEEEKGNYSSGDCSTDMSSALTKPKKSVRWDTITVHEFGVGLGGSAVSNKGGPSIGLADAPEFTWTIKVGEMAECVEGVHRFSPNQRIRLLQAAGIPDGIITRHARETNIILGSRRRSKISLDDSEVEEAEEGGEEDECREPLRKRSADQALLERPCAVYLRRPRMIPVNYV